MMEVIKKINDVPKILIKNWKMGTVDGGIKIVQIKKRGEESTKKVEKRARRERRNIYKGVQNVCKEKRLLQEK